MGLISCAKKYPVSTFHPKNPALQDSILVFNVFNQDCELVSQLPIKISLVTHTFQSGYTR